MMLKRWPRLDKQGEMVTLLVYQAHVMESSWMVLRLDSDIYTFSFLKVIFSGSVVDN